MILIGTQLLCNIWLTLTRFNYPITASYSFKYVSDQPTYPIKKKKNRIHGHYTLTTPLIIL